MSDAPDLFQFQLQLTMLTWLLSVLDTTCKLLWIMTGKLNLRDSGLPGLSGPDTTDKILFSDAGSSFNGRHGQPLTKPDLHKLDKMITVHSDVSCKMYFC